MLVRSFFVLVTLLFSVTLFAQNLKLTGKIVNDRNEPLAGVSIKVEGSSQGTTTSAEGVYSLSLAPGTKYVLLVSAIGFESKSISDVEVKGGEANDLSIALNVSAKSETEVIVRSVSRRQESTNALLQFQRNNTSLSSGIAADFIRRTPDRNTGEVLKRVSGTSIQDNKFVVVRGLSDRYNQAFINNAPMPSSEPDRKAFSFDLIPSQMIDNIIINKTATPDLTGEFAGGLILIRTKDVPTKNLLSLNVTLGYNSQSTFKEFTSNPRNNTDWLGFDNGKRSLPSSIPSVSQYRSFTDKDKISLSKEFPGEVYKEETSTARPVTSVNLTWSNAKTFPKGGTFGTIISLSHRNSMVIYDNVERGRFESVRSPIFTGTETQNRYSVNAGAIANLTYTKGGHKISFKNLFNQFYEDIYFTRNLLNTGRLQNVSLRSSFLNQRFLYSGQLEGEHSIRRFPGVKFSWNGNVSHNNREQPDFRTAQYVQTLNAGSKYELDDDDTRRFFSNLKDYSAGFSGALFVPFTLGSNKQSLKLGGSSLVRFRDFNARVFRYTRPASSNAELSKPYNEAFRSGNINADGLFLDEQTQNTDKYFAVSAVNAGYVMFDNKVSDKLRLIWGARAEFFEQFLTAREVSLKRTIINTEKWDILPSINATYSFSGNSQLRASASKTLARPEFREIAPFQFFDYEQIWGISGETDLKRTSILNGDLRYEFYPKAGELLSLGVLYKHFDDPIELRMDGGSNGDRWLFNYTNADKALLYGAEIEVRKGLEFINGGLKDLTFISNVTLLKSNVTLYTQQASGKDLAQDRPLYGQSSYLLNGGFQYTNPVWNATLLYNRIGPRLYLVGDPNGAGFHDIYEKSRNLLDIQVSKKILKRNGELKLTVSDLFNNKFAFYDNPSDKAGYSFADGDRINYAYRPGTTLTVGFTYDLELKKKN